MSSAPRDGRATGVDPRTESADEPVPAGGGTPPARWLLVLAGPVLWFTHFCVVYVIGEVACVAGASTVALVGSAVATVVGVVAQAVTTAWSHRWRRSLSGAEEGPEIPPGGPDPDGTGAFWDDASTGPRDRLLAGIAIQLNWLFLASTVVVGASALVLSPC